MKTPPVLAARLAIIAVLIAGIIYLEESRYVVAFRLWTFVLFTLALAVLASILRGGWRDAALIATSLAFGLSAVEGVATVLRPPTVIRHSPRNFMVPWSPLGWEPSHAGQFQATRTDPRNGDTIYNVIYSIDPDHLRETRSCQTGPTIGFFGCSFTFGEGLNDADTLPQQVSDLFGRNLRVLNFGLPGYGPHQFLREMQLGLFDKQIGPQPRLFIYLTAPWHAERTSGKASWVSNGPRYALIDGEAVYQGRFVTGVALGLKQWADHSAAYRMFIEPAFEHVTHADIVLYVRILIDSAQLAKKKYGVPLVIAYMNGGPYLQGTGFTDDEIVAQLRAAGIQVLDVSLTATGSGKALSIRGDGHPTAYANHLRAEKLRDYISTHFGAALSLGADGQPLMCGAAR